MSGIDLSPRAARRELGPLVEASDDADIVTAFARAVWSALVEPGDRVAGVLVGALGAAPALDGVLAAAAGTTPGSARASATAAAAEAGLDAGDLAQGYARWMPRLGGAPAALAVARRSGALLITPEDTAWPGRVDDLGPHAPLCLWVRGAPEALSSARAAVAIIGARAASSYGEHVAAELAAECAATGTVVYSGAAYGIDAAAHRAALSVGGATVAVMAGGVDRPYPSGNLELIERIAGAGAGAVIAEVACGTAPTKHRFLARNRLIAALSDATVVVEAGWRSGSLNTAHHAQQIGRPLGVVPGPITSATSMGCHRLLREGDAICVTGADDVRELIGEGCPVTAVEDRGAAAGAYTGERTRVLDALSTRRARTTDDVARRAGFTVDQAAALLGLLELEGLAARRATGWVQRAADAPSAEPSAGAPRSGPRSGPSPRTGHARAEAATLW